MTKFTKDIKDTKPIFSDQIRLALRVNAIKNEKGSVEKEGHIMLIFMDGMKNQVLGEFVLTKNTAKSLVTILTENITNLEKQRSDKSMPKPSVTKTTGNIGYR